MPVLVSVAAHRRVVAAACLILLFLLAACGGASSGGSSSGGDVSITSVSISLPAYTQASLCANFTATVSGTGNYNHSVQWYVNGVAGGSTADGLISSSGNTAPPCSHPRAIQYR